MNVTITQLFALFLAFFSILKETYKFMCIYSQNRRSNSIETKSFSHACSIFCQYIYIK